MILLTLAILGALAHAAYAIRTVPANDVEQAMLGDRRILAGRWAREFGGEMPARYPWRLPLEYALWPARLRLVPARILGGLVGAIGVAVGAWWAGDRAWVVVALVATCPTLVVGLTSASYVPWVSTLWVVGLADGRDDRIIAYLCGVALVFLRPTAWWQGGWLIASAGAWWVLLGLAICMLDKWPNVVRSQGWWRLVHREPCPVQGLPRDGWRYGITVACRRFPLFVLGAGYVAVAGSAQARWLLGLTVALFVATHLPRMLIRPKWAVGYVTEWCVPVAVAVAVA